eukprot:3933209-Pyramimonas_sp.AAC.1
MGAADAEGVGVGRMAPHPVEVADGVDDLADGFADVAVVVLLPELGERPLEELGAPLDLAHEPVGLARSNGHLDSTRAAPTLGQVGTVTSFSVTSDEPRGSVVVGPGAPGLEDVGGGPVAGPLGLVAVVGHQRET